MKLVPTVCLILALSIGAYLSYRYAQNHGFSAREKPNAIEAYIAKTARRLVIPDEIKNRKNPLEVNPVLLAEARDHFADHCAMCHANNGSGQTQMGQNMYPPAPDMRTGYTQSLTDGELLYIIREGIRLSGMPGWGGEDKENWKLVHFIRHLPELSEEEIGYMKEINDLE